jgi:hypothetical protein
MIKTVLVPGAPWPKHEPEPEKPKFKHKSKPIRKIEAKPRSKIKRTNDNFDAWLESERQKAKP